MEGDHHVGQMLDTLKELGMDDNTLVVFASDNGPQGQTAREMGNQGTPDMGSSGPFRGELGDATEGAIRTVCFVRWPGKVQPRTSSYAMFSIMDFFPTFAQHHRRQGCPTDRPIDGVDQTDVLLGKSATGNRDSLLTFIGADLVAARWKQLRACISPMCSRPASAASGATLMDVFGPAPPMAGYPEDLQHRNRTRTRIYRLARCSAGRSAPMLEVVEKYLASLVKKYPNPPAPDLTSF